jgi:hypothetical protein
VGQALGIDLSLLANLDIYGDKHFAAVERGELRTALVHLQDALGALKDPSNARLPIRAMKGGELRAGEALGTAEVAELASAIVRLLDVAHEDELEVYACGD